MGKTTISYELEDEEGAIAYLELPGKFEVCSRCEGAGSHANPAIDGHGITQAERDRDWTDEEWGRYMRGGYDVSCYACDGRRVEHTIDWAALERQDPELAKRIESDIEQRARWAAEEAHESRMGY